MLSVPFARTHPLRGGWGLGIGEVVVLGKDAGGTNTDTIFTLKVQPGSTTITQIPRDSYINPDGFGAMKINGLLVRGGPEAVERELTRLMKRPVRHHVVVSLKTLPLLANLLGGIEVDVPKRLYYVDHSQDLVIDLQPGRQVLRGKALEGFLRWRDDGRGDIGRLERQKLALKGLVSRLRQPQHLVRIPLLLGVARTQIQTDLNLLQMGKFADSCDDHGSEHRTAQIHAVQPGWDQLSGNDLDKLIERPLEGHTNRLRERTTRPQRSFTLGQRSSLVLVAKV